MSTCPDCVCTGGNADSPLSTTANILSILTFAFVVLVSILYQVAEHRHVRFDFSAERERAKHLRRLFRVRSIKEWEEKTGDKMMVSIVAETDARTFSRVDRLDRLHVEASRSKWTMIRQGLFDGLASMKAKEKCSLETEISIYETGLDWLGVSRDDIGWDHRKWMEEGKQIRKVTKAD
jgi:hypothetical protein